MSIILSSLVFFGMALWFGFLAVDEIRGSEGVEVKRIVVDSIGVIITAGLGVLILVGEI